MYIENPKTKGSGIVCAIPQVGRCPNNCADCFFQSGRSYLEPLNENLPNVPDFKDTVNKIIRVNDGNDSNHQRDLVIEATKHYPMKFYNTSQAGNLERFLGPVVLTVNPGPWTDRGPATLLKEIPKNLMFVRVRVNMWNLELVREVVDYYSERETPVVLTSIAYFDSKIKEGYLPYYSFRERTLNNYWVITGGAWKGVMSLFEDNKWVYSCGKSDNYSCKHCGNCLREYFATMEEINA